MRVLMVNTPGLAPSEWQRLAALRGSCVALLSHRYACDPEEAEDMVSQAIVELAERGALPTPENPLGDLFQIAKHRLIDARRARIRQESLLLWREKPALACDGPEKAIEQQNAIVWYLSQLAPSQRVRLLETLQQSISVIAERSGRHPGSVKAGLAKTRKRLQQIVQWEERHCV